MRVSNHGTDRAQLRRALPVLVRFFRYATRRRPINTEDPITQEKLSFPVFFHVTETNTFAFHAPTLIAYITATGDFRNPLHARRVQRRRGTAPPEAFAGRR